MRLKRIAILFLIAAVFLCTAVGIYAADYYHMDERAANVMLGSESVTVTTTKNLATFSPEDPKIGLIFYPGGKVEYTAYAPLMELLASNGILCVIPHMPLNPAVMDINMAEKISAQYPEIETWYIGGHSLGGSMAASHAAHCDIVKGVILLAAYSTADLSSSDLRVLSIYGSRDQVLNKEKYASYRTMLPEDTVEIVLDGGNHAQFGSYGKQKGDGTALISEYEQQIQTMSEILYFTGLSNEETPAYEYEHYTFWLEQENKAALRSVLTLTPETAQFILSEPIFSSRMNTGTYTIENNVLICSNWDGAILYCFDVTEEGMSYRATDSTDIYAHGSVFADNVNAQAPVPNGALYILSN